MIIYLGTEAAILDFSLVGGWLNIPRTLASQSDVRRLYYNLPVQSAPMPYMF